MTDIFDGDKLIIISANGADFNYTGGQPEMDQGFQNHVNIALLTEPGWYGNDIEPVLTRKIGAKYIDETKKPITRQSLIDMDRAAEFDVSGEEFGSVTAETTNPVSQIIKTAVFMQLPTEDIQKLSLTRTGQNWLSILNK